MEAQGRIWGSRAGINSRCNGGKTCESVLEHVSGITIRTRATTIGTHCLEVVTKDTTIYGDSGFFVKIDDVWTLFIIGINGTNFPNDQTMYNIHTGKICPCSIVAIQNDVMIDVTEMPHNDEALTAFYYDAVVPIMTTYQMYGVTDMDTYIQDRRLCEIIAHMCGIEFTFGNTPKMRENMSVANHLIAPLQTFGNLVLIMIIRALMLEVIANNPWMHIIGSTRPVKHAVCDYIDRVKTLNSLIKLINELSAEHMKIPHVNPLTARVDMMRKFDEIFQMIANDLKRVRFQMTGAMNEILHCMKLLMDAYLDRANHYYLPLPELSATITQMQRVQSDYNSMIGNSISRLKKIVSQMQNVVVDQLKMQIITSVVHELRLYYPEWSFDTYIKFFDFDYLVENMIHNGKAYPPKIYTQDKFDERIAPNLEKLKTAIANAKQYQAHHDADIHDAIEHAELIETRTKICSISNIDLRSSEDFERHPIQTQTNIWTVAKNIGRVDRVRRGARTRPPTITYPPKSQISN